MAGASVVCRLSSIYRLGIENATTKNKWRKKSSRKTKQNISFKYGFSSCLIVSIFLSISVTFTIIIWKTALSSYLGFCFQFQKKKWKKKNRFVGILVGLWVLLVCVCDCTYIFHFEAMNVHAFLLPWNCGQTTTKQRNWTFNLSTDNQDIHFISCDMHSPSGCLHWNGRLSLPLLLLFLLLLL